jgi:UDP-N-acetylmuramyl pentapeptide phosphotransferase/UDP-N-acetylglucosamine-1-phosphate transferase
LLTIIIGAALGYVSFKFSMRKRKYGASFMAAFVGLYLGFLIYRYVF